MDYRYSISGPGFHDSVRDRPKFLREWLSLAACRISLQASTDSLTTDMRTPC